MKSKYKNKINNNKHLKECLKQLGVIVTFGLDTLALVNKVWHKIVKINILDDHIKGEYAKLVKIIEDQLDTFKVVPSVFADITDVTLTQICGIDWELETVILDPLFVLEKTEITFGENENNLINSFSNNRIYGGLNGLVGMF